MRRLIKTPWVTLEREPRALLRELMGIYVFDSYFTIQVYIQRDIAFKILFKDRVL